MEANIQWFDPSLGTPMVSVSPNGLTFNRAAVVLLGGPEYVEVGVDGKARVLVVRKAGGEAGEAGRPADEPFRGLAFRRGESPNSFVRIGSKDLVRFIEASIPDFCPGEASKYLARYEAASRHLVVDLRQRVIPRKRKKGSS